MKKIKKKFVNPTMIGKIFPLSDSPLKSHLTIPKSEGKSILIKIDITTYRKITNAVIS